MSLRLIPERNSLGYISYFPLGSRTITALHFAGVLRGVKSRVPRQIGLQCPALEIASGLRPLNDNFQPLPVFRMPASSADECQFWQPPNRVATLSSQPPEYGAKIPQEDYESILLNSGIFSGFTYSILWQLGHVIISSCFSTRMLSCGGMAM